MSTLKEEFDNHVETALRRVEHALRMRNQGEIQLTPEHKSKLVEALLNLSEVHNERARQAMDEVA